MNEEKRIPVYRFVNGNNGIEHIKGDDAHIYQVNSPEGDPIAEFRFASGTKQAKLRNEDLLEIVRARLVAYNAGKFANKQSENALRHVEEAILWLCRRAKTDNAEEVK